MDLRETDILGDSIAKHWYYLSKAGALRRLLDGKRFSTVLDVGAGSGFFSRHLLSEGFSDEAWCVDISYLKDFDSLEAGKPVHFRMHVDKVNADLVLLMDVLEHVDDAVSLLSDYVEKVPMGARFVLSVPAFQFLWSDHDVFLEHRRRYQLKEVEEVARNAGLTVVKGAYYFGAVLPIAMLQRLRLFPRDKNMPAKSQLSMHHPFVNGILASICQLELPFITCNRLAGLTAFCVAEKS